MSHEHRNIMVVAGEASGDMHAASLVRALQQKNDKLRFYGVGGRKLRQAGVALIADSADMAVVGLTEVFAKLPFILKVMNRLKNSLLEAKPDAVILVDYPDFNLVLAKAAHERGIKVFYYISPQIWAWRSRRIRKIRKFVDKMAVILPFEAPLYQSAGVDAIYVGHPLLDVIPLPSSKEEARKRFGIKEDKTTISILPGSRQSEVERLLPLCLKAGEIINRLGGAQFVLPVASALKRPFVEEIVRRYGIEVLVVDGGVYDVLSASDLAIVASGTATLEAALMETPMVIIYRLSLPSYILGKIFIHVKNIGLVNIIAGKTVVPELLQTEANPVHIARIVQELFENKSKLKEIKQELSKIKNKLGTPGVADRTAQLVFSMLTEK